MYGRFQEPHVSVYLLSDHLDAILAAGEDLRGASLTVSTHNKTISSDELVAQTAALTTFIASLRENELSIAVHLRQARLRASEVALVDQRFASLLQLFLGGTAVLHDALADLVSDKATALQLPCDPLNYLRGCGLLDEEAAGLENVSAIEGSDAMLIAGRIELGPLLDLVAAFLDSLDSAYDLYPDMDASATASLKQKEDSFACIPNNH